MEIHEGSNIQNTDAGPSQNMDVNMEIADSPAIADNSVESTEIIAITDSIQKSSRTLAETERQVLDCRYAELEERLYNKRRHQKIAIMKQEFADNIHDIGNAELPECSKHQVLKSSFGLMISRICIADSSRYEAKSLKEIDDYTADWQIQFEATPQLSDTERIPIAVFSLYDFLYHIWAEFTEEYKKTFTGEIYLLGYRKLVIDPINRMAYISLKIKEVQQQTGQIAGELSHYIENLEQDIFKQDPTVQKTWTLLNVLKSETYRNILKENTEIIFGE